MLNVSDGYIFISPSICELQLNSPEPVIAHHNVQCHFIAENVKDILRERDGLKFIANLLTLGTDMSVKEAAMFSLGCAVESNGNEQYEQVECLRFSSVIAACN